MVFNSTAAVPDPHVFKLIKMLATQYRADSLEIEIWLNVLYAGMIAEENKKKAILKKRIKRLGMHQVLIEKIEPEIAAVFSKGKNWKELDILMKQKGF